jgi:hypothetical protein
MELRYELTQKDFLESFLAHRSRRAFSKWSLRVMVVVVFMFAAFGLVSFAGSPSPATFSSSAVLFGLACFWALLLWGLPRRMAHSQFSKQPGAHGPRTLLLDNQGAHWRWNGGSADVQWQNFIRILEGKNQFLFYTSPACFNILPKRALAPEQLVQFRQIIAQSLPSDSRKVAGVSAAN